MTQRRLATLAAPLLACFLASSCIGPFNATARVTTWNREIENRWAGEAVYLVFSYLPIYTLCFVGDVLVFNSIEFWGGENPITPVDPERYAEIETLEGPR